MYQIAACKNINALVQGASGIEDPSLYGIMPHLRKPSIEVKISFYFEKKHSALFPTYYQFPFNVF